MQFQGSPTPGPNRGSESGPGARRMGFEGCDPLELTPLAALSASVFSSEQIVASERDLSALWALVFTDILLTAFSA